MISSSSSSLVGEKTPLLLSVSTTATDTTPATSASTTPSTDANTVTPTTTTTIEDSVTTVTPTIPHSNSNANTNTNSNTNANANNTTKPKHLYLQQKADAIEFLLSQEEIDLWKLREFALTPGGLVNGRFCLVAVGKTKQKTLHLYCVVSLLFFSFYSLPFTI